MKLSNFLLMFCVSLSAPAATLPGIVSFSSNLSFLTTPPPSLRSGSVESNTTVYGLVESTGVILSAPLPVNAAVNGAKNYNSLLDLSLTATLPEGMQVNSYLLHFDPTGAIGTTVRSAGVVTLQFVPEYRIAGIQLLAATLRQSANSPLLAPGVTYEGPANLLSGLELKPTLNPDWVHVIDNQTVEINMQSIALLGTLDEVRILVETPEPGAYLLVSGGLGLLFWRRRRVMS